jgi:polysaccharide biosynthesis transport protein
MYQQPGAEQTTPSQASDRGEGVDLAEVGARLWRRKSWIFISMALAGACVAAYLNVTPPEYTASLELLLDPSDLRVADNGLRPPMQSGEWQIAEVENQLRLLTSGNVMRRVVGAQSLAEDAEFASPGVAYLPESDAPIQEAIRNLGKKVRARRAERTYVVTLEVTARTREKAVALANAFVDAFTQERAQAQAETAIRVASSLNEALEALKQQAADAEERLVDYKKRHSITLEVNASGAGQFFEGANDLLKQAHLRTSEAQAAYDEALARRSANDFAGLPNTLGPNVVSLRDQYAQRLQAENEAIRLYGQQTRRALRAKARRLYLAKLIQTDIDHAIAAKSDNLERARANEKLIASHVPNYEVAASAQELEHELWAIRTLDKAYKVREVEVAGQQKLDTSSFRVISPAMSVGPRSWPPPSFLLFFIALIAGGVLGAAAALLHGGVAKQSGHGL